MEEDELSGARPYFSYDFENIDWLTAHAFVHPAYNPLPTLVDPNSPDMLEAKMKNGDAIAEQLDVSPGAYVSCKDVNEVNMKTS